MNFVSTKKLWRGNQIPTHRPPLPPRTPSNSAQNLKKSTTLHTLSSHSNPKHERINPFLNAPWQQTPLSFPTRFVINPHLPNSEKQESTKFHLKLIDNLSTLDNTLYIYTDGSLLKRSGFQRTGAAVVGYRKQEEVFHLQMGLGGHAEIFDAELAGLSMAAHRAAAYAQAHPDITNIHLFTDCSSALTAVHCLKPAAGQSFSTSFRNTITQLLTSDQRIKVSLSWCPSHSGIKGNDRADALTKKATERACDPSLSVTRTNALRRTKVIATKLWQREWRKSALTGQFAIANRLPPSLNTTHHFSAQRNNRELFGRTLQCRTGHGHTGEFRKRFSLDGQYECPCGEPTETREHILRDCPRYNPFRHRLELASPHLFLPTILGSKNGISALSDFLQASGAFSRPGADLPTSPPTYDDEPIPPLDDDSSSDPGD